MTTALLAATAIIHAMLAVPIKSIPTIKPAVHPRQLSPYRPPATTALFMRLNGNAPCSAHSSRQRASLARLSGVSA
jgi:hypothetical protein